VSDFDLSARPDPCLSDLTLDRLLAGELDDPAVRGQRDIVRAHLAACPSCQQRRAEIEAQPALAPDPELRRSLPRRPGSGWRLPLLAAMSVVAAAAAVVLFARPRPHGAPPEPATTRIKGGEFGFEVVFKSKSDGRGGTVLPHVPLHPGDVIGFRVRSRSGGYLAIVSVDGAGVVSSYLPGPAGAMPLLPPGAQTVEGGVSLDAVAGRETLVAVLCAQAADAARALAAMKAGAASGGELPRLDLPCQQARAVLLKDAAR